MHFTRLPRAFLAAGLVAVLLSIISCSGKPKLPEGVVPLRGTGATFPAVLYHHWFETFNKKNADLRVEYKPVGSSGGVEAFLKEKDKDGEIDFAASDNGMTADEVKKAGRGVLQFPITGGLVAIAYNLPGVDNLRLSREAYTGIFLGKIKRWNDPVIKKCNLDMDLPNREIQPYVRQDGSGTTFMFSNHLSAVSPEWKEKYGAHRLIGWPSDFILKSGNDNVAGSVSSSSGAVGYVDLGSALEGNLKTALLENRKGEYVEAKGRNASLALQKLAGVVDRPTFLPDPEGKDDYPIVGLTYVMVYRQYGDAAKRDGLKKLLLWCLEDEGQDFCGRYGYVRLPANLATEAIQAVQQLGR